jgi:hypothetical protein
MKLVYNYAVSVQSRKVKKRALQTTSQLQARYVGQEVLAATAFVITKSQTTEILAFRFEDNSRLL